MSQRNLFEKAFLRRQGDTYTGAVEGAVEVAELVIDHADVKSVAAVTRRLPINAGSWIRVTYHVDEAWVNGGNAVTFQIGNEGNASAYHNDGSHTSDTTGTINQPAAGLDYLAARDAVIMTITPASTIPTAGRTRVLVQVSKAPKPVVA